MSVNIRSSSKIKKAPAQKDYESVCGLDALYFYIKVNYLDYSDFFVNHLLRGHLESDNFVLLNKDYTNQFTYFRYMAEIEKEKNSLPSEGFSPLQEIGRIGFKNLNENLTCNLPRAVREYARVPCPGLLRQTKHYAQTGNSPLSSNGQVP